MSTETFQSYIAALVRRYGTAQAIADGLEMSLSAFSRGVRNEGTLSTENLLKLCKIVGDPPARVFTLAGKAHIDHLVRDLYGDTGTPRLSEQQRTVLTLWDSLDGERGDHTQAHLTLLRASAAVLGRTKTTGRRTA